MNELNRYVDAARGLEGWELEFEPEPLAPAPPWDYEVRARNLAAEAGSVLDLGTGGGEVLSRVLSQSRARAVATECWHVNAPVAARRLGRRADVVRASSLELPFAPASFDLVLSRHEELAPAEVGRVLSPAGRLLTQQTIPDFSIQSHADGLAKLATRARSEEGLVLTEGFYLIEARAVTRQILEKEQACRST